MFDKGTLLLFKRKGFIYEITDETGDSLFLEMVHGYTLTGLRIGRTSRTKLYALVAQGHAEILPRKVYNALYRGRGA